MVLTGTKRSLRTGNTLRNVQHVHTNKRICGGIVRRSVTLDGLVHGDLDDPFLTSQTVEFSLNKKGRWNLPEIIGDGKLLDGFVSVGSCSLSVQCGHRISRQTVRFTREPRTARVEQQSDVTSTSSKKQNHRKAGCRDSKRLDNTRRKSNSQCKKRRVFSEENEEVESKIHHKADNAQAANYSEPSEVSYEIFYPLPSSCGLRFNPKVAARLSAAEGVSHKALRGAGWKPNKTASKHRQKRVDLDEAFDEEDYDEEWEGHADAEDGNSSQTCRENLGRNAVSFAEFFTQARGAMNTRSGSADLPPKNSRKGHKEAKIKGAVFYRTEAQGSVKSRSYPADSQSEDNTDETESTTSGPSFSSPQLTADNGPAPDSVEILLRSGAASIEELTHKYGSNYKEAECFPRTFLIDITERLREKLKSLHSLPHMSSSSFDLSTYVIFSFGGPPRESEDAINTAEGKEEAIVDKTSDTDDSGQSDRDEGYEGGSDGVTEMDTASSCTQRSTPTGHPRYDTYRVQVNINCDVDRYSNPIRRSRGVVFEDVGNVVEHVVESLVRWDFINTLHPGRLVARSPAAEAVPCALTGQLKADFAMTRETNGWSDATFVSLSACCAEPCYSDWEGSPQGGDTTVLHRPEAGDPESAPTHSHRATHSVLLQPNHADLEEDIYCGICFEELSPGSRDGPQASALRCCRHWFCEGCWRQHLSVAVRGGRARGPECPQYQCQAVVDPVTLLSLMRVRDVRRLQCRLVEDAVTRTGTSKWCPNTLCGRLVQLPGRQPRRQPSSMTCPCGKQFCFRCHGAAHWPMSCAGLRRYHGLLHTRGQLDSPPDEGHATTRLVVRGKECPFCQRFIEKSGGCPEMRCLCGRSFWWCCGLPYNSSHSCRQYRPAYTMLSDLAQTQRRVFTRRRPRRAPSDSQWYELALHHRQLQHPQSVRRVRQRARDLGGRLAEFYNNHPHAAAGQKEGRRCGPDPDPALRSQQIRTVEQAKATITTMVRLKMELHHVIEHTAAVLHFSEPPPDLDLDPGLNPSSVRKVKDVLGRLTFEADTLDLSLGARTPHEIKQVLLWFRRVQRDVRGTLAALVRVMEQ